MVAPAVEAIVAPVEGPKPTGPKVIVPRTIALGPAPAAPTEPPVHRTPPIIVTGEPGEVDAPAEADATMSVVEAVVLEAAAEVVDEPVSVIALPPPIAHEAEPIEVAEVTAAVEVVEVEAGPTAVGGAIEPEVTAKPADTEAVAVAAPVKAETATAKPKTSTASKAAPAKAKVATPNATKSKAKTGTTAKAKPPTPKPAKRPPAAVPVMAQPTPVIDPGAVWPGKWLRDVSPDTPAADAPDDATFQDPKPKVVRRDPSLPVPRVAVVADDWDRQASEVAAVVEAADTAVAVAESAVAVADPEVIPEPVVEAAAAEPLAEAVAEPIVAEAVAERIVAAVVVARPARPAAPARKAQVATPRKPGPRPAPPPRAKTPPTPLVAHGVTTVAAFCPYCALALEPPPTASRRCTRCRQRIVVKRVQGRVVYLTEAAVEVFDSERLRSANFGRWSKERAQWLKLATSVGADAGRIARLGDAPLSEKVVESSRTLYLSTTERSYREAKRDDRWEDASRMKRDQAAALYRLAGSPVPPPADVVAMHREAAAAELRGIGKMARDAELVGSTCCSICTADDGRTYKIVSELRTPRLPHDSCPKGLCHCRWEFALRDAAMVRRYLKRTRGKPKSPSA
jgi:hypothetical protein